MVGETRGASKLSELGGVVGRPGGWLNREEQSDGGVEEGGQTLKARQSDGGDQEGGQTLKAGRSVGRRSREQPKTQSRAECWGETRRAAKH